MQAAKIASQIKRFVRFSFSNRLLKRLKVEELKTSLADCFFSSWTLYRGGFAVLCCSTADRSLEHKRRPSTLTPTLSHPMGEGKRNRR
jgi:hypothetical protein